MKTSMQFRWLWSLLLITLVSVTAQSQAQEVIAHDPVMTQVGDKYYLFTTGPGVSFYESTDMVNWQSHGAVFKTVPTWTNQMVPEFDGHMWAPDIYQANGQFYLYYSISAFGKNTSAIGVVTNKTLDPASQDFKWVDHGPIVQSVPHRDLWNAIDPAIIADEQGDTWMSFGSFWSGIKLVKLDASLTKLAEPQIWHSTAKRDRSIYVDDALAYPGAIEAPFIIKRGQYYYQFVSWDFCCRGVESTYKVVVGRSKTLTGPYLDKSGKSMAEGGGSIVLQGDENWFGLGHNSIYEFDGKTKLVFHAYDAKDNGAPKLKIVDVTWSDKAWPEVDSADIVKYKSRLK
ncbi:arabinan endo-1,5-alpha-L-arabinosidase (plasmid) [Saccharobesus litoralis]|uniref:Extracellular exo-alpha-(1->5)-L-arabinofuranosidase n=1 Tax=Saccharobesus litoralis TaxID=2172099 RepID=A0A2S0VY38_9ALTE|nr:arabinan endo-1,5-alpha-L-arabinosidase [Saccharobesus litoralis]AWB69139.1 arabinan endo-1,5-alpha-L-arabinosidase [Saccharobesus litoralis]